ncbi:MAG: carbohydrate ABC transporter permease, partial [Sphaerochaeta sp.]|nr:carbohydrate ABC transporter permease [Sphaerochaeta sp.]
MKQISKKIHGNNIVIWLILTLMLLFTLTPIIFMISASMMERTQIMRMPFSWIPESFNSENFIKAVAGNDQTFIFVRNLSNSLFVSVTVAITTVLIASLTGYGLAKFR